MTNKTDLTVYVMVGLPGSGKSTWAENNHPELPVVLIAVEGKSAEK